MASRGEGGLVRPVSGYICNGRVTVLWENIVILVISMRMRYILTRTGHNGHGQT